MGNRIGFIGLGIMGKPMALNLLKSGCELIVYDIDPNAVGELVGRGAAYAPLSDIGGQCERIFTILPNGGVVREVLFGPEGVAGALRPGSIVVDMSSVTPLESRSFAGQLAEAEIGFLDAPVSGGEPKAIDGTLAFMVGGREDDFLRVKPVLEMMGAAATWVGPAGSGSVAKLANQIIVNLNIAAVSEALVFAAKAGVDPERVYQAIRGGLAGSVVLDAKAPMMMTRNFQPGGKISINHKDIKNVLSTAHDLDVPLPLTAQLFEIMQYLKVRGCLDEDHSAIVKYFEHLAQTEVKAGANGAG